MATKTYTWHIDPALKEQSEAVFAKLGVPLGTAINVFLKKAVAIGGFPFEVCLDVPDKETVEAMHEAEKITKDLSVEALSVEDALEYLKA